MWTILAFIALGFLIGNLIGLTAESVTSSVLALLFAFGGGSAIAFIQKLNIQERVLASKAILALAISCLIGVYAGIYIAENQIFTPDEGRVEKRISIEDRKYLRENIVNSANSIDQLYANKQINLQKAYMEMYQLTLEIDSISKSIHKSYLSKEISLRKAYVELHEITAGED